MPSRRRPAWVRVAGKVGQIPHAAGEGQGSQGFPRGWRHEEGQRGFSQEAWQGCPLQVESQGLEGTQDITWDTQDDKRALCKLYCFCHSDSDVNALAMQLDIGERNMPRMVTLQGTTEHAANPEESVEGQQHGSPQGTICRPWQIKAGKELQ